MCDIANSINNVESVHDIETDAEVEGTILLVYQRLGGSRTS